MYLQLLLPCFCFLLATSCCGPLLCAQQPGSDRIDFATQIRPLLSDNCFFCHGPDENHREASLRFDIEESAKSDLGGYRAISEGQPDESELIVRILSEDEFDQMPPPESGKSLTDDQKQLLVDWIRQGAQWQDHWAYVVPRPRNAPGVKQVAWPTNWVDQFVLARIENAGLEANPIADRRTLIRRLYFDLIGLPPTPSQVQSFVEDQDLGAYEKLVDHLLASDHFGERLAIYWLDLVRYADTVGYHGDQDHNVSPYRDWVIDAFNDNLPFDQFTREQLAGDLLENPTTDQQIAAAYNRLLQTSHEGGVQPGEYTAIYAADRVRNVSAVWMGATLGCAQCHDHKYDPYTTRDFYSMAAFFADIDEADHFTKGTNDLPTARPPEAKVLTRRERERLRQIDRELESVEQKIQQDDSDDSFLRQRESLQAERESLVANQRSVLITRALAKPRVTRVLPRGNWLDSSGEIVEPQVPAFLGTPISVERRANRLDLANWLTDSDNGAGKLTARIMVNRLWFLYFGRGIASDLGDFGGQGQVPVYPGLLDQLSLEFVRSKWDLKHMIKLMVTSQTYRQSSVPTRKHIELDPENQLFARQLRFRLPAELIRDNALSISGLLVDRIGGRSVKPYQPAGYYRHLNFPQRKYEHDKSSEQWRRGLYVHWQRQFLQPMLKAFDAPMREECTAKRQTSNTPLAALALLNDPTFLEASRSMAGRILDEGGDTDEQRLRYAFLLATNRQPQAVELQMLLSLLDSELAIYREKPAAAKKMLQIGISPVVTEDIPRQAAWMSIARVILNLNETMMRN